MTPDELKALRRELGCTARDLATTIGVDQDTLVAWEKGELFPTKRYVDLLEDLRKRGPSAVVKKPKKGGSPMELLADPGLWLLVRKLIAHDTLRKEVARLAERYPDPAEAERS
ncbi:MAG: helix-turn-helix transcriptional regulator [Polyangiaceae bacterium]|nr:helix-turn-helix transcriptional regulator [Polyangiaceae bacterium]